MDAVDIAEFVDTDGLDPICVNRPYQLVPYASLAEEGYRPIREALRASQNVAIGQVVPTDLGELSRSGHMARACA